MAKPIIHILLSNIAGFIFFLILLGIANLLIPNINYDPYAGFVNFLNASIMILVLMMFIGLLNELFWNFKFPFNIFAPVISSVLSVLLIMFLYDMLLFIEGYFNIQVIIPMDMIYLIIPILVLVFGYIIIFVRGAKDYMALENKRQRKIDSQKVEWDDIGNEFKSALYKTGENLNKAIDNLGKKKKKK
jgi:hypothetical protein